MKIFRYKRNGSDLAVRADHVHALGIYNNDTFSLFGPISINNIKIEHLDKVKSFVFGDESEGELFIDDSTNK